MVSLRFYGIEFSLHRKEQKQGKGLQAGLCAARGSWLRGGSAGTHLGNSQAFSGENGMHSQFISQCSLF